MPSRDTGPIRMLAATLIIALGACGVGGLESTVEVPAPRVDGLAPIDAVIDLPYYMSFEDQDEWIADCMRAEGFAPRVDPDDGRYVFDHGDEIQIQHLNNSLAHCNGALYEMLSPFPEETPEFWRDVYRSWLWTRECVAALGLPVDRPPPLEVFVDNPTSWHPYDALMSEQQRSWEEGRLDPRERLAPDIERVCPEHYFFLFGYLNLTED